MEIKNRTVLILGGWGLMGTAVCRKLLEKPPRRLAIASLTQEQSESIVEQLKEHAANIELKPVWGNIFVRTELKDLSRTQIINNPAHRLTLAEDVLERTTASSFKKFFLYELILAEKPDIIIDCVNSATALAYQDVYTVGLKVLGGLRDAASGVQHDDLLAEVQKLLCTLYLPQLVRHVQVLYQAMKEAGTKSYIKIGTTGTGGMGLNIPYTHSEDKPSRVLLSKSSVAGAHSLLLFLMGRTPDSPFTKEIKPAAAIAWKRIARDEILRDGKPIELWDCDAAKAETLTNRFDTENAECCKPVGENLEGVYIDTGENGTFSLGEFTAITTAQQMEYITPEEVAQTVIWEIEGGATGHDIVAALDAAVLGPSYRAGVMRTLAVEKMRQLVKNYEDDAIAFELLGPPRLSKLLYEAHFIKRTVGTIRAACTFTPERLSELAAELIKSDFKLRSRIISIGIPILMPDGRRLLRGPQVKVPHDPVLKIFDVSPDIIDNWSRNGWVDLRVKNFRLWLDRLTAICDQARDDHGGDTSSRFLRDSSFWRIDQPLDEGEVVGWIFIDEDDGVRIK